TELLLKSDLAHEQREKLKIVKHSANSLLHLLNEILDFSKIEAGKIELETIAFDLRESFGNSVQTLAMRAAEKRLELVLQIPGSVPNAVVGDPLRLLQVVVVLVDNAIKFTSEGEIVVSIRVESRNDDQVELLVSVRDTGIGIPPDKQDRLFK